MLSINAQHSVWDSLCIVLYALNGSVRLKVMVLLTAGSLRRKTHFWKDIKRKKGKDEDISLIVKLEFQDKMGPNLRSNSDLQQLSPAPSLSQETDWCMSYNEAEHCSGGADNLTLKIVCIWVLSWDPVSWSCYICSLSIQHLLCMSYHGILNGGFMDSASILKHFFKDYFR